MIFYFSGTGNSQLAADLLARGLSDQAVSITPFLKKGGPGDFYSEQPLVFVAPTYAWRMPRVMERWIRGTRFQGDTRAYFVLTCGGGVGGAAAYARALCKQKGLRFCGLAPVLMPENYLAMFPTPGEAECRALVETAKPRIEALAGLIRRGQPFPALRPTLRGRLQSGPVNRLYYPLLVHDKKFTVSPACVSCGKCARRCPLNNIELQAGMPVWKGRCTHCMACIAGCPAKAIEYGAGSAGRHRHYIFQD